jgi:hypothetical protein
LKPFEPEQASTRAWKLNRYGLPDERLQLARDPV